MPAELAVSMHGGRLCLLVQAERGEQSGRFTDVPLDGVQAVAAVGQVRDAEILARGEEVLDALGDQGAQGDLEGERSDVDVVLSAGARVKVDAVVADADAVFELVGDLRVFARGLARVDADVVFRDGELRADAAGFADVRVVREAVRLADDVGAEV